MTEKLLLLILAAVFAAPAFAQGVPQKANARPSAPTDAKPEPFDKADVKAMAAQCVTLGTEAGAITIEMSRKALPNRCGIF